MALRPLINALRGFPKDKQSFLSYFGKLSLADLGFYVEDVHAMKYFEDSNYPITRHAFMLENALKQMKFVEGIAADGQAGFFPVEWKNKATDRLGCSTLCDDAHVTLCWFVIPPGRVLPLHDHPTMSVWQRVLFGKVRITAVDWLPPAGGKEPVAPEEISALAFRRASEGGEGVVVFSDVVEGSDDPIPEDKLLTDITHFTPLSGGGVLRELENVSKDTPALFVDVIAPPYLHPPTEIPCTYFTLRRSGISSPCDVDPNAARGVTVPVTKGDRVTLAPRQGYYGPEMNAFAHLSD